MCSQETNFIFLRGKLIKKKSKVVEILDVSHMNVVEKLLGVKPTGVLAQGNTNLSKAMYITAKKYSLIASVNKIKKNRKNFCPLSF